MLAANYLTSNSLRRPDPSQVRRVCSQPRNEAPRWAKATIAEVGADIPKLVDLSAPRPLSADERRLLDFLLDGHGVHDELRAQADSVEVVSVCDCGCRSVGVRPGSNAPDVPYTAKRPYFGLTAHGRSATATDVGVTLHVVSGRMTELEIWDGFLTDSQGELPDLATLRHEEPL